MKSMALLLAILAGACGRPAEGATSESRATVVGTAVFDDAPTDAEGTHADPATPAAERGAVWLTLTGNATIDDACADAAAGVFDAHYSGEASYDAGRITAPLFPASTPPTTTPSGCAVSKLAVHGLSDVTLLAELPVSPGACRELCAGHGRRVAYERCMDTSSDQAGCRAGIEGPTAAACEATCSTATAIAGYGSVNGATLPAASSDAIAAGALGDVESTIVLDHVVDANNRTIQLQ